MGPGKVLDSLNIFVDGNPAKVGVFFLRESPSGMETSINRSNGIARVVAEKDGDVFEIWYGDAMISRMPDRVIERLSERIVDKIHEAGDSGPDGTAEGRMDIGLFCSLDEFVKELVGAETGKRKEAEFTVSGKEGGKGPEIRAKVYRITGRVNPGTIERYAGDLLLWINSSKGEVYGLFSDMEEMFAVEGKITGRKDAAGYGDVYAMIWDTLVDHMFVSPSEMEEYVKGLGGKLFHESSGGGMEVRIYEVPSESGGFPYPHVDIRRTKEFAEAYAILKIGGTVYVSYLKFSGNGYEREIRDVAGLVARMVTEGISVPKIGVN